MERIYKVVFGQWVLKPTIVYVKAKDPYEAQNIVMDEHNIPRGWIMQTAWARTEAA